MILGIVGSEEKKFDFVTAVKAKILIRKLLRPPDVIFLSSGHCHAGGIDIWAEEIAMDLKKFNAKLIFPAKVLSWDRGYKPRNIQIAKASDMVICITVAHLPSDFQGMTHPLCYHCGTKDHVKSGGCWTVKYAREQLGKRTRVIVI